MKMLCSCLVAVSLVLVLRGRAGGLEYPKTKKVDQTDSYFGTIVSDPYRWLEDQNSPETRKWIEAQNAYTHTVLDQWPGRGAIEKRLTQLQKVEVIQSPTERAGRFFFRKRSPDQ